MGPEPDTLSAWLKEHPPSSERFSATLAAAAQRSDGLDDLLLAARELLDEVALAPEDAIVARAIAEEPSPTGDERGDAYLAAVAEHVAVSRDLPVPAWALEPGRFLDRFWFVSDVPGFRATAVAQAPAAFRRRGVFVPARSLQRV